MSRRRAVTAPPRTVPVGQMRRNLEAVQRFRLNVVFGALIVLFAGLLGRLAKLQLVDASAYAATAETRHADHRTFQGLKGRVLDAHGRTLVTSRRVLSVAVDPKEVAEPEIFARRLAALLDDPDGAARILDLIQSAPVGCRHRSVRRIVDDERLLPQLASLRTFSATIAAGLRGLKIEEQELRSYPNGTYAAHVLGRAPRDEGGQEKDGHGVEDRLHHALQADVVCVPVLRDGSRRRGCRAALAVDCDQAAARDVGLTLDLVIQHYLETALDRLVVDWEPEFTFGIALDPQTGHVLALANRPTFDPAREMSRYNYAVHGSYEPGSLFKPFTVARALSAGVVTFDERVEMPPRRVWAWRGHRRPVNDSHPTHDFDGCGTVTRIIGFSSNTGVAELAWRLMEQAGEGDPIASPLRTLLGDLGFDTPSGLELEGEGRTRYDGSQGPWNPLFPALGVSFGQGFCVSPIRLAAAFAAFARDDARIVRPTLLPGRGGPRRDLAPVCASADDLATIRAGLLRCVEEGTARRAFDGCAYRVAGKTGTAQLVGTPLQYSSFAGFAPAERPRVLVLVVAKVDERFVPPTTGLRPYGGNVAGPAVRSVIERSLAYLDGRVDEGTSEEGR